MVVATVVLLEGSAGSTESGLGGYVALASSIHKEPAEVLGFTKIKEGTSHHVTISVEAKLGTVHYFVVVDPHSTNPRKTGSQLASVGIDVTDP